MLRLALSALVALLLAVALSIAGYALWLAVADRGPRVPGIAAPPPPADPDPLPEPQPPSLEVSAGAGAAAAVEAAAETGAGVQTRTPWTMVRFAITGAPDGARAIVLEGNRHVPVAEAALDPSGAVEMRVPSGKHRIVVTTEAHEARSRFLNAASFSAPTDETIALDARPQEVALQLPPVSAAVVREERAILELALLRREDDPYWMARPTLRIDESAEPHVPTLVFADLGPGRYRLEWPELRAASLTPAPAIVVPGPTRIELQR